jgi:TrmH family RNA methyltransferase
VGSIFRTAEAFGVEHIYISPFTPLPTHKRAVKTARGCEQSVAWSTAGLSVLDELGGVFALELGGTPIDEFVFPGQGVALIGSEELGLSPEALELAAAGAGRVSIPMAGAKRSLNVATAAGILLHKWFESVNGHSGAKHTSRQEMNEK